MKLYIKKLFINTFCIIYCIFGKALLANYASLDNLVRDLKQDTKMNQLLLLYEDYSNYNNIYHFGKNISRVIPTRIVHFKNIMEENEQNLKLPPYLLESTKVIIIPTAIVDRNLSKVLNLLDSIANLAEPNTLPKVLVIIRVTKSTRYGEFFQLLWRKQFLDVTILESRQSKSNETLLATTSNLVADKLQYYNPFTKKSIKTTFSKESILFPDKLRDLKGYKIYVGIFHLSPYLYVTSNSTGHVLEVRGPDFKLVTQLSNSLNFSIEKVSYVNKGSNPANCTKNYNVGLQRDVIYNEIQFIGSQLGMTASCYDNFVQKSRGTRILNIIVLVPILPSETSELTTEWNLYKVINILCLFLMPWLIARILSFDRRFWKLMYTIQIVLGSSTPQTPKSFAERVVFMTFAVFYFLQSSYIYTTFSNLQLQKFSHKNMETLEELVAANLTFIVHGGLKWDEKIDKTDAYPKLMKRAIFSRKSFDECAETLMEHRNVTCMGREHIALQMIQKYKTAQDQSKMYILKELIIATTGGMYLAGGSPYKYRFQQIACALMESGISDKWDAAYIPKGELPQNQLEQFKQESSLPTKGFNLMVILLLVGHSCSILVFAAELHIHKHFHD